VGYELVLTAADRTRMRFDVQAADGRSIGRIGRGTASDLLRLDSAGGAGGAGGADSADRAEGRAGVVLARGDRRGRYVVRSDDGAALGTVSRRFRLPLPGSGAVTWLAEPAGGPALTGAARTGLRGWVNAFLPTSVAARMPVRVELASADRLSRVDLRRPSGPSDVVQVGVDVRGTEPDPRYVALVAALVCFVELG